ncbi:MAG: hypothetical protein JXQ29_14875 [Planctomycetes bacterium]|nr:hypothetical protein [Planctomycetota bacterium]
MMDEDRIGEEEAARDEELDAAEEELAGEPPPPAPAGAPAPSQSPMKRCVCCGAIIPLPALNCSACRSWVALWEGSIAKEYFYLLVAALTCVFGTLLPWKALPAAAAPGLASEVLGIRYMSGAVICLFSLICAVVCLYNIRSKKLLFWPILLLLVENLFTLAVYFMAWELKVGEESYRLFGALSWAYEQGQDWREGLWNVYRTQGIGLYFVIAGTLFILVQIVWSVIRAAAKGPEAAKKSMASRGRRR